MADEKDEKFDEKEREKRDEKTEEKTEEKTWEEKWQRDPVYVITWAAIFIWAGLVFLASNLGILDWVLKGASDITGMGALNNVIRAWPVVLIGAGVIILLMILIRLLVPAYRKPIFGSLVVAIILIAIGLGDLINWGVVWGALLIILGIWIMTRGGKRHKES
jgi:hypothetical protein